MYLLFYPMTRNRVLFLLMVVVFYDQGKVVAKAEWPDLTASGVLLTAAGRRRQG